MSNITQRLYSNNIDDSLFKNFTDLIRMRSSLHPSKTAFIFLEDGINMHSKITYRELYIKASAIASEIQRNHKKHERCLLIFPSGLEFIISLFACWLAGIIAVPVYPPRRSKNNKRFWSILEDSKASLVLTNRDYHKNLLKHFRDDERLSRLDFYISGDIDIEESKNWQEIRVEPSDLAVLQYTSGSTGSPKGVMVSHANIFVNSTLIQHAFNHDKDLVVVTWLPNFHDMGLFGTMLQPFFIGGTSIIIPPAVFIRKPITWLNAITKYKGSTVGCPNFALDYCVDNIYEDQKKELNLSSLKVFFCGAEPIRKSSFERFKRSFKSCGFKPEMFYPCYGLAESTLMVTGGDHFVKPTFLSIDAGYLEQHNKFKITKPSAKSREFVGNGYPWVGGKVMIVNPETRNLAEDDEIGEIWTSGPSICLGYWKSPEATNETFNAYTNDTKEGPFLRTGDLGFIHEDQLYVTGRLKDLIIIRGQNYYPQDIEESVEDCHEAIQENAGAAFPAFVAGEERLVIVQEIKRIFIRGFDPDKVFEAIRKVISEDYEIEVFAIVLIRTGSINKTTSGKIQHMLTKKEFLENKLKVVARWQQDISEQQAYVSTGITITSVEDVQQWLINWLSNKVKINPHKIDPNKPILSYGLDSIGAVELENEARTYFGIELAASDFLENNKISELANKGFALLRGRP